MNSHETYFILNIAWLSLTPKLFLLPNQYCFYFSLFIGKWGKLQLIFASNFLLNQCLIDLCFFFIIQIILTTNIFMTLLKQNLL